MAEKWKLSSLFVDKEVTFATDPDATGAAYKFVKAKDMTFEPMLDVVERDGLVNDLVRQAHAIGAKNGKVTFSMELKGSGTSAGSGVQAIAPEADPILEALFGQASVKQTGSLIQAGGTATTVVVTSGAAFTKYGMIGIDCGATYGVVPRFITNITGNTLTFDRALPGALSCATLTGNVCYGSSVYKRTNSGHASLAFACQRGAILYTFLGCKFDSAKITGTKDRGTAMLDLSFSVTDWNTTAKASLPITNLTGITATKAPVIKGSPYAVGGTEELIHELDFDFGHKFVFRDSTCALGSTQPDSVNAGLELVDAGPSGTIKPYYAAQHMTDFAAGTQQSIAFSAIDAPSGAGMSRAWGIYAPQCQYKNPTFEDHNGIVGQVIPFMVNDNSTDPEYVLCLG